MNDLNFHSVTKGNDSKPARIVLTTGNGQLREVALTRVELINLISQASSALILEEKYNVWRKT